MGADIYLNSVYKTNHDKVKPEFYLAVSIRDALLEKAKTTGHAYARPIKRAQKKVDRAYDKMYSEGYFRDSYNNGSLFWVLGLSWWKLAGEILNKHSSTLSIRNAKKLLKRFESGDAQFTQKKFNAWVAKRRAEGWTFSKEKNEETVEMWAAYFKRKHASWVTLLKESIRLKEPLDWSV